MASLVVLVLPTLSLLVLLGLVLLLVSDLATLLVVGPVLPWVIGLVLLVPVLGLPLVTTLGLVLLMLVLGLGLLLVVGLFASLAPDSFLTPYNLKNVATQTVIVGLGAIGMTFARPSTACSHRFPASPRWSDNRSSIA